MRFFVNDDGKAGLRFHLWARAVGAEGRRGEESWAPVLARISLSGVAPSSMGRRRARGMRLQCRMCVQEWVRAQ